MNEERRRKVTVVGWIAMQECGFDLVELHQVGAPTPGRIADRLHDVIDKIEDDVLSLDAEVVENALSSLRCLLLALDTWDAGMLATICAAIPTTPAIGTNTQNPPS